MKEVVVPSLAEHTNVIDVPHCKIGGVTKDVVHEPLKCGWGIFQPKWHYFKLELSKLGDNAVLGTWTGSGTW